MTVEYHHRRRCREHHHVHGLMKRTCTLTRTYPATLFWLVAMAALIAVTAGTASTLVGIVGVQLFILALLMHEVAMSQGRRRRD